MKKIVKIFYPTGEFAKIPYNKYIEMMDRAGVDTSKEYNITVEPLKVNDLITVTQENLDGTDGTSERRSKET